MALRTIDAVRGLAALGVVLFHYGGVVLPTLRPHPLEALLAFGEHGVEVFFVLSGFVIPYSLVRSGYTWSSIGPFMWKRYLRIAPLAYISALLMIGYHLLSLFMLGRPVQAHDWPGIDAASVIGNLLFHPQIFGSSWFNFAFWTLALEFEFYLAIALTLPILLHGRRLANAMILVCALSLSFVDDHLLFRHCGFFIFGVAAFLWKQGRITAKEFASVFALTLAALLARNDLAPVLLSAGATVLLLWKPALGSKRTDWLGAISYSLYIVHVPVGYFAESAMKRLTGLHELTWGKVLLLLAYTLLALIAAQLLYQVAERPLLDRLKRIDIGDRKRTGAPKHP
ncbi:MAG: acyltransferase [Flavobacteriales bacterium]|nr:acyltransferase [Flavobacteriales bacterium]